MKAVIQRCKIVDCETAIISLLNSTVLVADCEMNVDIVMKMATNLRGKVKFQRNSVRQRTDEFLR